MEKQWKYSGMTFFTGNTYFMAYRDRLRDLLLEGTDDVQW